MYDLVVFDMVGTTIKDDGEVLTAFLDALHQFQIPANAADLEPWRGASKHKVLSTFVECHFGPGDAANAGRISDAYAAFRRNLEGLYARDGVQAIPGAEATFDWLRERGIKIALTTGFYRRVTELILESLGWRAKWIDASVCSEDVAQGRPAPYMIFRAMEATGVLDVRRVVKVGDTVLDLQAGSNAGVAALVGVLSGVGTREQLAAISGAHIISSAAGLPRLLA
jgi:phosphonatase-like hydrolase